MKKFFLPLLLLGLCVVALWRGSAYFRLFEKENMLLNQPDLSEVSLQFQPNNQRLRVTLAKSEGSRAKGLGEQSALTNDGMLFLFPISERWQFWMKGMQFGLDFIWIENNRIVGITSNVPAPDAQSDRPYGEVVSWNTPVNVILELPAGKAAALGLAVGNTVEYAANPK